MRVPIAIALCTAPLASAQVAPGPGAAPPAPEVGKALPAWSRGMLDIHQLSTGRGNSAFFTLPDGTTLLVDAGAAATAHAHLDYAVLPAWSATHPSQDALKRMLTQRLYPGPHDVFVTPLPRVRPRRHDERGDGRQRPRAVREPLSTRPLVRPAATACAG